MISLGEASESDSEEISLGIDEETVVGGGEQDELASKNRTKSSDKEGIRNSHYLASSRDETINSQPTKTGFKSSLIESIGSTSAFAKLVSSYNTLASNAASGPTTSTRAFSGAVIMGPPRVPNGSQLSLLHETLYMKNQQLYACLNHIFKHPYQKAFVDLHSISQRLVGIQKTIQDVNSDVLKIKRELKNLDFKPNMIF